jgi:hypothetical protein
MRSHVILGSSMKTRFNYLLLLCLLGIVTPSHSDAWEKIRCRVCKSHYKETDSKFTLVDYYCDSAWVFDGNFKTAEEKLLASQPGCHVHDRSRSSYRTVHTEIPNEERTCFKGHDMESNVVALRACMGETLWEPYNPNERLKCSGICHYDYFIAPPRFGVPNENEVGWVPRTKRVEAESTLALAESDLGVACVFGTRNTIFRKITDINCE